MPARQRIPPLNPAETPAEIPAGRARELLEVAPLRVLGRLPDSSNSALVVVAGEGDQDGPNDGSDAAVGADQLTAVYKPVAGERPLWDFPARTLAHREVATHDLSWMLGWDLVPLTVWREDGPAGPGMCQRWVDGSEPGAFINIFAAGEVPPGWHLVLEGHGRGNEPVAVAHSDAVELRELAVFDVLANNADRKIGHVLVEGGRLLGIDHGLTFHVANKLRTVFWGFAGAPLDPPIIETLARFVSDFDRHGAALAEHLAADEVAAARRRAESLLAAAQFPAPQSDGPSVPWPIV